MVGFDELDDFFEAVELLDFFIAELLEYSILALLDSAEISGADTLSSLPQALKLAATNKRDAIA
jgi:hypothetical protein